MKFYLCKEPDNFQFLGITRREKELKKQLTLKDKINLEGNFNTSDKSRNAFMLKGNKVTFKDDTAKYVISRKWSLVDDMEVFNAGCEYGVYEE